MYAKDSELASKLTGELDGETVDEAVFARVDTAVGVARYLTPLGNYLVARPAARAAAKALTEKTDVPLDAAVVFGLTADKLHVWKADPALNMVHDHLGHVPLSRIAAMTATAGRSWQKFTMTLEDDSIVELDARGNVHALIAAFDARPTG